MYQDEHSIDGRLFDISAVVICTFIIKYLSLRKTLSIERTLTFISLNSRARIFNSETTILFCKYIYRCCGFIFSLTLTSIEYYYYYLPL